MVLAAPDCIPPVISMVSFRFPLMRVFLHKVQELFSLCQVFTSMTYAILPGRVTTSKPGPASTVTGAVCAALHWSSWADQLSGRQAATAETERLEIKEALVVNKFNMQYFNIAKQKIKTYCSSKEEFALIKERARARLALIEKVLCCLTGRKQSQHLQQRRRLITVCLSEESHGGEHYGAQASQQGNRLTESSSKRRKNH
ncbi:hypothetical protein CCH79_00015543, partial [Gambusia affinis]